MVLPLIGAALGPVGGLAGGLGAVDAMSGIAETVGSFFGGQTAAQRQAHEQNKLRVAQINQENQRRLFEQLQVNARFTNQKARVSANLDNIDVSAMQARARSQQRIDEALDQFMFDNQARYVQMAQKLSGNKVRDRSNRAMLGRASAQGMSGIRTAQDKMMTSNAQLARTVQEARMKELSTVATAPTQANYIESYTPQRAPQKGFMDYLNLAAGIGSSVVGGFDTYNKFKPKFPTTGGGSSLKIGMDNFKFGMNNPMDIGYDLGPLQSIGGYN